MSHLYLPTEHTDTDLALASAVAEAIDSNELFVAWTMRERLRRRARGEGAHPAHGARPQRSALAEAFAEIGAAFSAFFGFFTAPASVRGHAPAGARVAFGARERLAQQRGEPPDALDEDVRRRATEGQPQVRAGRLRREARAGSRRRCTPARAAAATRASSSVPSGSRSHRCSPPVGRRQTASRAEVLGQRAGERVAALAQARAQRLQVPPPAR